MAEHESVADRLAHEQNQISNEIDLVQQNRDKDIKTFEEAIQAMLTSVQEDAARASALVRTVRDNMGVARDDIAHPTVSRVIESYRRYLNNRINDAHMQVLGFPRKGKVNLPALINETRLFVSMIGLHHLPPLSAMDPEEALKKDDLIVAFRRIPLPSFDKLVGSEAIGPGGGVIATLVDSTDQYVAAAQDRVMDHVSEPRGLGEYLVRPLILGSFGDLGFFTLEWDGVGGYPEVLGTFTDEAGPTLLLKHIQETLKRR